MPTWFGASTVPKKALRASLKFIDTQILHQTPIPALGTSELLIHTVSCFYLQCLCYWLILQIDAENISLTIESLDRFVASALVCQGIVPCSLISPSVGITVNTLELYRVARLHSPHFSIQAYIKSICDLHSVSLFLFVYMSYLTLLIFRLSFRDIYLDNSPSPSTSTFKFALG